ncbi:RNA-binding protein Y14 [Linum perenne]
MKLGFSEFRHKNGECGSGLRVGGGWLMDEEGAIEAEASSPRAQQQPKLKSAITGGASTSLAALMKTKGRGFREEADAERRSLLAGRESDSLGSEVGPDPQRCFIVVCK